jgi:hypothetical protein
LSRRLEADCYSFQSFQTCSPIQPADYPLALACIRRLQHSIVVYVVCRVDIPHCMWSTPQRWVMSRCYVAVYNSRETTTRVFERFNCPCSYTACGARISLWQQRRFRQVQRELELSGPSLLTSLIRRVLLHDIMSLIIRCTRIMEDLTLMMRRALHLCRYDE